MFWVRNVQGPHFVVQVVPRAAVEQDFVCRVHALVDVRRVPVEPEVNLVLNFDEVDKPALSLGVLGLAEVKTRRGRRVNTN